jgi:replicative DNA helicase
MGNLSASLPANIEAEAALLGALMTSEMGWLIEHTADHLTTASFFEPLHGEIFDAVQRQHSLGKPATPVFIRNYFEDHEALKELGGTAYLARLTAGGTGLIASRELTEQIADLAKRRKIMVALSEAHEQCADIRANVCDIVSRVDAAIDDRKSDSGVESGANECMEAMLADLDTKHVGVHNRLIQGIDDLLGALEPKSLTILAARPGMGKTAVAVSYALGAADAGHGVCFVSLEMSREQLGGRMIADFGFDSEEYRVPYAAIQRRSLNPVQRDRVNDIARWIGKLPLSVIDAGTLTVGRLNRLVRSQQRRMAAKGHKLELLIVDYLQLLHCDERKRSPYEAISEISVRLKAIAKDNGIAVLALAQLSRNVETRPDKRPVLADLRDSGQIEQDADAVLFLLRDEYYLQQCEPHNDPHKHAKWEADVDRCRGVIEFILAKRRNGTIGTTNGRFYGAYQAVR